MLLDHLNACTAISRSVVNLGALDQAHVDVVMTLTVSGAPVPLPVMPDVQLLRIMFNSSRCTLPNIVLVGLHPLRFCMRWNGSTALEEFPISLHRTRNWRRSWRTRFASRGRGYA